MEQSTIIHDNPADYGLTDLEVKLFKLIRIEAALDSLEKRTKELIFNEFKKTVKYWREELKLRQEEYDYYKGCLLRGNIFFDYSGLNEINCKIKRAEKNISFYKKDKGDRKEFNIEEIKKIPLNTICEILPSGFFVHNPFRNEKSPSNSLYWYKKQNRWTDFGIGESGDVIDLFKAINKCNTSEAMKRLSK